jgi:hypothetical protein
MLKSEFKKSFFVGMFIFLEVALFCLLFFSFPQGVFAGIGTPNATVVTTLMVGNVFPEVTSVVFNSGNNIDLTANATKTVYITAIVRDYNGDDDIKNVSVRVYDSSANYNSLDDNNNHYTNFSCYINKAYGDEYQIFANCSVELWYYSNNATWTANVSANDTNNLVGYNSTSKSVNTLIALGVPNGIDYGTVNATSVSEENFTNVTNLGNVMINLSFAGYALNYSDGIAMNCTLGSIRNISIYYEKYNITGGTTSVTSLTDFEAKYRNLTNTSVVNRFNMPARTNDTYNDIWNATFWRIYVPIGVAGNCTGNIVIGAVVGNATWLA